MGDIADDHIARLFDGYDDDEFTAYRSRRRDAGDVTCKFCGLSGLKWRVEDGGWRLVGPQRVHPGNYLPLHECRTAAPASPDEFDAV